MCGAALFFVCGLNCCTDRLVVSGVKRDARAFCTTSVNPGFGSEVLVVLDRSHGVGGMRGRGVPNWL